MIELLVDTQTFLEPYLDRHIATSVGPPENEVAGEVEQMLPEPARTALRQDDWRLVERTRRSEGQIQTGFRQAARVYRYVQ